MPLNCGAGEDSWESLGQQGDQTSQSLGKSTMNTQKDWSWSWNSSILVIWCEWKTVGKVPETGKDREQDRRASEDEMAGWHLRCNGHELGQTSGNGEGQGGLACCSPWDHKQSDTTGQLNNNVLNSCVKLTIYSKPSLNITAAAAAKSLQSCPTLCDPIDGSPPGSPVPGILQVRTLEWVAISFSNAWKWKVKVKSLSHVQLLATPLTYNKYLRCTKKAEMHSKIVDLQLYDFLKG